MIARRSSPFSPLWVELKLAYYRWALREIDPLHRDVPHIVRVINRLESQRRPA